MPWRLVSGLVLFVATLPLSSLTMARELPYPCGPDLKFEVRAEEALWTTHEPLADGRGRVYVLADTISMYNLGVAIDGKWVGANWKWKASYFLLDLAPGEYHICAAGSFLNAHLLPGFFLLKVDSGKTYFLEQKVEEVGFHARVAIRQLDEYQATQLLRRSRRSIMVAPH